MIGEKAYFVKSWELEQELKLEANNNFLDVFMYDNMGNDCYRFLDRDELEEIMSEDYIYADDIEAKSIISKMIKMIDEGKLPSEFYLLMSW